jgi:DNA-binding NarL/FixJ family response regulator
VQYLLTARELAVLRLLALGSSNKEIAAKLDVSIRTAESHRASIMHKLKAASLADLVRMAIRDQLI